MSDKKKVDYPVITLDGEALYLKPWEDQKGLLYGPKEGSRYDVTLVNLDAANLKKAIANGRQPTVPKAGSTKDVAGFKKYYKFTSLFKIPFVDSQTNDIDDGTLVGNGSKIRVYLEVRPIPEAYQEGSTHKFLCTGVQLLEMVEMPPMEEDASHSNSAKFGKVEGGYEAPVSDSQQSKDNAGFTTVEPEILDDEIPF
jgi:hypothetical protein